MADAEPRASSMANRKRGALWIAALVAAIMAATLQIALVARAWSEFDSRLSCDGLTSWSEWPACMQGPSHQHIVGAEMSLSAWAIAGVAGTLGRFLSFILPVGMAMTFAWFQIGYWLEWYRPGIEPTSLDILNFIFVDCLLVLLFFGPSISAWLLALHRSNDHARLQLSTVFE
jgi:hypothetical protein